MEAARGRFVVMGVSGTGKTRIGTLLAGRIGGRFVEGDDLHSEADRAKMGAGIPLTDEDRAPWLDRVAAALAGGEPPVAVACSALRRRYRDRLRATAPDTVFLHLAGDAGTIGARLGARRGHFMPASLLASQFEALEPPEPDERAVTVDTGLAPEAVVDALLAGIARL